MKVSELTADLDIEKRSEADPEVRAVAYNSRNSRPGSLYVAIRGSVADGHSFIGEAVRLGAVAVVVEKWQNDLGPGVAQVLVRDSRKALAMIASAFYGHPCARMKMIGITGTNGKTTTAHLLESIYRAAGAKTGMIGTIEYRIGDETFTADHTTPQSLELQQILFSMVEGGVEVVIMEVSSHALKQHRVDGCEFACRLFTNLSQDHLDYHATLDDYFNAKARLFADSDFGTGTKIVNIDLEYGRRLALMDPATQTFGVEGEDYIIKEIESEADGIKFALESRGETIELKSRLIGEFNVANIAAAAAAALSQGLAAEPIVAGVAALTNVPGRFEVVSAERGFQIIVDYAHTPDGLEKVLAAARALAGAGRLITVFGCGGDRDKGKRPKMGRVAAQMSDLAVVTTDNPRTEDPEAIISDILGGITDDMLPKTQVIADRESAIYHAIALARAEDVVLIAGKGHESHQLVGDAVLHFDDRVVARRAVSKINTG